MASAASHASFLPPVLTFCAAAVVAVPLFRRLGLSAVIGYLAAGVVIGPAGFSLIDDPGTAGSAAELGVGLLLFIVGVELKLSRPLSMRGDLSEPYGQRAFAVLLFQDLAIVPILALLPLLATAAAPPGPPSERLASAGIAVAAIAAVVIVGRYRLNPFFRLLAASGAREVLTASALLVVLGTALLLEDVGLSMAMGAFLAGVLLAESNFRHQLEADIEPFRGILLGLFFMSVGMSIDGGVVRAHWLWLVAATLATVAVKAAIVAFLLRIFGSPRSDAVRGGALLATAGEFGVLPLAGSLGLLTGPAAQFLTALAALTMLVAPIAAKALDLALAHRRAGR